MIGKELKETQGICKIKKSCSDSSKYLKQFSRFWPGWLREIQGTGGFSANQGSQFKVCEVGALLIGRAKQADSNIRPKN